MPQIKVKKTMVIPGEKGKEMWPSNDCYVSCEGEEMIGAAGLLQMTREAGQVGSSEEWFNSGRMEWVGIRRSLDNGMTWEFDEKPFWELTPEIEDLPYGYVYRGISGHILDEESGALIRIINSSYVFGPVYFGGGSPSFQQNRMFYQVSCDGGRDWTSPRQIVCDGERNDKGDKYYWLEWAPDVKWGHNVCVFDQPSWIKLDDGTFLLGIYRRKMGTACWFESAALRMKWTEGKENVLSFSIGDFISVDEKLSHKGCSEATFAKLDDGRILVVLRTGGNEKNGTWARRYYAISDDGALTWNNLKELTYDDGSSLDVPESMSKMWRSSKDGQIYWVGNVSDEPIRGCYPRNRLVVARVNQNSISIIKDSITVIDESPLGPNEKKYSNFVLYEDRFTQNLIVLLGELPEPSQPQEAKFVSNGYRYEIYL